MIPDDCPPGTVFGPGPWHAGRVWKVAAGFGILTVATGWLPWADVVDIGFNRAGPILGFLAAVTILAELSDSAGVFDAAADLCARLARGSTALLFLLIAALATAITIGMSLDTTAVLLTPVVLAVTTRLGLRPLPFALLVVWLANTASLLLPVSNLTNLLAMQHAGMTTVDFAARMALPQLVAVLLTVLYLGLLFRRSLTGGYTVPAPSRPPDRVAFVVCALACLAVGPAVLLGVAPWQAAAVGAVVTVTVFAIRRRAELRRQLFPWRLILLTEGLFLVVAAVTRHGLGHLLAEGVDHSGLRTTAVAAAASNLVNNLPAYLAVETAIPAGANAQLFAALIGTNAGPLILMWGSLATLLWSERCRARGVTIRPLQFAAVGAAGVPIVLVGAWLALSL